MSEQEQQLVKKKGKTISTIWKYFGFQESDVEQNKVQCRICYQVVLAPHANTTNLFNHLKYNHKVQYDRAIIQQKADARSTSSTTSSQSSIQDALYRATAYATSSQRHRDITGAITFHIAKDMCPVSTVSNQGFKQLVNTLDKRYAMPSRYYFSRFAKQIENLRCSEPVFAEFNRITSRNLEADFFEALDQHTPRFIQLFKSKKGSVGQKLQSINWPTPDVTEQRSVVLKGIPIVLGDDSKDFFKTCFDTTRDEALSSVTVGVLTVLSEDSPQEGPSSMQLEPISTDIVLEGGIVMEKIKNFPQAC
ncbi:hypothetical protein JOQ06_023516 [Pogonophryne albipinna]|uniref:BED-type domain-containing protein n=1 Tax=Pogonophryne albipinna TaxID=1090488 RepID=A0AAD6BMY8_9TELE|nr:hypothetical protein JOQ06_023516 [Pogonophryne albipinna]